jgi:Family of unknown function (DUF5677)
MNAVGLVSLGGPYPDTLCTPFCVLCALSFALVGVMCNFTPLLVTLDLSVEGQVKKHIFSGPQKFKSIQKEISHMDPVEDFIPRNIQNESLAKLLDKFGESISQCVNFCSNLVVWITESKTLEPHDAVLVSNLRHFIEQIDACSELVKKSISEPCLILLRAAMESFLTGSYILQSNHEQRGMSFYYSQFLEQIKILDKMDSSTNAGMQFTAIIGRDDHLHSLTLTPPPDLAIVKTSILARMNSPSYSAIHTEYLRIKTASPRNKIPWYSLFGGPNSIEKLADVTGNSGIYEIFYRHASGFVHGTKILSKGIDSDGVSQIRMPFNAQFITSFSLSLSFILFRKYIEYYCPSKMPDYLTWYLTMRNDYIEYSGSELIKI